MTSFRQNGAGVWGRQPPSRSESATAPGRAHGTGTVYKCALVPSDLFRNLALQQFFLQFLRPRQTGKGYEKCLDGFAVRIDGSRKYALQNQAMLDKAVIPGAAFLATDAVQQNLLLVLKLINFLFGSGFILVELASSSAWIIK